MPHVCLVSAEYPPLVGGVGDFTRRLAGALARRGARVSVLTAACLAGRAPLDPDVDVIPALPGWGPAVLAATLHQVRRLRPDALDVQYQPAAFGLRGWPNLLPAYLRLRRAATRVGVTFHDLRPPYLLPKVGPLRTLATVGLAGTAHVAIATNAEDHARLARWRRGRPTAAVPIGPNVEPPGDDLPRPAVRQELGAQEGDFLVGHFGFLHPTKGVDDLLRAFALLRRRRPGARLAMLGDRFGSADPSTLAYACQVDALVAELGLAGVVRWTGYLAPTALTSRLQALDVCALPYRHGVSLRHGTLMAALAHGLPIVTTQPLLRVGSPRHSGERHAEGRPWKERGQGSPFPTLRDGEGLRLVPAGDPAALAACLEELAQRPDERRSLAESALRLARRFAWDTIASETLRAFHLVAPEPQP